MHSEIELLKDLRVLDQLIKILMIYHQQKCKEQLALELEIDLKKLKTRYANKNLQVQIRIIFHHYLKQIIQPRHFQII